MSHARDSKQQYAKGGLKGGLVSLGVSKRTKSGAKLTVPKPVNLPSLKKENAGNDPTTQLVPSGQSGWSAKGDEPDHNASSLVERSTWASGEPPRPAAPPQAAWQRPGTLNPSEFPSLAASASGKPPPPRPPADHQGGNWDEDEREYCYAPAQRSALVDRRGDAGPRGEHPGFSGGGGGDGHPGEGYGREGRRPELYGREGPGYGRDGGGPYGRDRFEPPYFREREHSGWERDEGRPQWRGSRGEGPPPPADGGREGYGPRYDRHSGPPYGGALRGPRHEDSGRWGSEQPRRPGDSYGEEYGSRGEEGRYGRPRYDSSSRLQVPSRLAADYDPELFPPIPSAQHQQHTPERGGSSAGDRREVAERDDEREAFNAELERVAAELERKERRQPSQDGGRGPYGQERQERETGSDDGQPPPYGAWGPPRRATLEDEERLRFDSGPRWQQRAPDERGPLPPPWEEGGGAVRRARELADAQAAAQAALAKPPPPGAQPAFDRRPSPPLVERHMEPHGPAAVIPPPPPPPPRPSVQHRQVEPPAAPAHPAAEPPAYHEEGLMGPPALAPAPPPPSPPRAPRMPEPPRLPEQQLAPAAAGPVHSRIEYTAEGVFPEAAPAQRRPAKQDSPPQSPRAGGRQQRERKQQAAAQQAAAQQAAAQQAAEQQAAAQQAAADQVAAADQIAAQQAAAASSAVQDLPAGEAGKSSLVKPGASWRSMLTGVPDVPAQPGGSGEEPRGGKGSAGRDGKRGKGKGKEARTVAVAAAAGPGAAAAPAPAAAEAGKAEGKGKGRGAKRQKAAGKEQQQQQQVEPGGAAAQRERGGKRKEQQQQQAQRDATSAAAARTKGAKGRKGGKAAAAAQFQPEAASKAPAPAAEAQVEEPAAWVPALPPAEVPAEAPAPVPVGQGEQALAASAGQHVVAVPPPAMASSAAAFGWSSPLADEVAKLQLSAAASADVELAAEVAAAAAAVPVLGDMVSELPAMGLPLLDQDLLEPSPVQEAPGVGAVGLEALQAAVRVPTPEAHPAPVAPAPVAAAAAAGALGDLLGDDVITALPADLTLDLAGGEPSAGAQPGSVQQAAHMGGLELPPARHTASPQPFPGGLFPMSMAVGGANPWQVSTGPQEAPASAPSLAAAAQSLYSLAQQPRFTFGTHTNITIMPPSQPPTSASLAPDVQYAQQQQQQQLAAAAAAAAAFGSQQAFGQQAGSFLPTASAFVPTGKLPDWSTPQGPRTASPVPLPAYPTMPLQQQQHQQQHQHQLPNGDAMLQYGPQAMSGGGRFGAGMPPHPHPGLAPMQYAPLHQQHQQQLAAMMPRQGQGYLHQHQQYDPAAGLPDDVFGEGPPRNGRFPLGPAPGAQPMRRGPPGRGRYDDMHLQQQQQQHMGPPQGLPYGGPGMNGYGGRRGQQPMMARGPPMPPPPQDAMLGAQRDGSRGGRRTDRRAGRSGRSGAGSGPQQPPPMNMKQGFAPKHGQRSVPPPGDA